MPIIGYCPSTNLYKIHISIYIYYVYIINICKRMERQGPPTKREDNQEITIQTNWNVGPIKTFHEFRVRVSFNPTPFETNQFSVHIKIIINF